MKKTIAGKILLAPSNLRQLPPIEYRFVIDNEEEWWLVEARDFRLSRLGEA